MALYLGTTQIAGDGGGDPDHIHDIADVTGLQTALDSKSDDNHTHAYASLTAIPATFTPSAHGHAWTEITAKPTTFTPETHQHAIADITNLSTTLTGKSDTGHSHAWTEITGKPTTFTPATHSHAISDVTNLQTTLDGKQPKATSVTALPVSVPTHLGQMAVDGTNNISYIAEGLTSDKWKRVATTAYVDTADNIIIGTILAGLSLWKGTQAQYDAIGTKSATTLYFTTG